MKVEIRLSEEAAQPYAVIYTNRITEHIRQAADLLGSGENVVTAMDGERIAVLHPQEIYMIRIEREQAVVYTKEKQYLSGRRLYSFEEKLGGGFMRISKSTLINLSFIDSVEPSFNGMMHLRLKNGCKDYISRKYLPVFKKYLGI